ncbi:hypothetical protein CGK31_08645 [Vibrio parahaemolyticus]|nr:hypothetical protein CGK31_08645 [Vibrio parahaemolyticus]
MPCRAGNVSLCKSVHREVESEGSKWQNIALTNRNLVVGIVNLGNLARDRIARSLEQKCDYVNQAELWERVASYLGAKVISATEKDFF